MHQFVETLLRHMSGARSNADIETLLEELAGELGYRSAFMLDFPSDPNAVIRLWDSDPKRAHWWQRQTSNGMTSVSREVTVLAHEGIQQIEIGPDDPRHAAAQAHDFVVTTVVPVIFDHATKGIVALSGEIANLDDIALSLEIVCYALLMQARKIETGPDPVSVKLTPREREVVKLTARGLTSEMVAEELGMSARTVNQHIDNIAAKLKTRNRVHTVAEALRRHLVA